MEYVDTICCSKKSSRLASIEDIKKETEKIKTKKLLIQKIIDES